MKFAFIFFFLLIFKSIAIASSVSGYIYDKNTREQLIGAYVILQPGSTNTVSLLSGRYSLNNLKSGNYKIKISYIGYETIESTISVSENAEIKQNFYLVPSSTDLSTIEVTAKGAKESDSYASRAEQRAENLVNIVSANSIAISPDMTVANVMARVSGVSIERGNAGDGQYAIIRGMDKRYNTTLINGVKIPSPDNKNRYVPLDIFPSDLIERIEVSKSLNPDMEGDASGGVINLVMKTAPDKFRLEGNIGTGYSGLFSQRPFDGFSTSAVNKKSPAEITGNGVEASLASFPYQNLLTFTKKAPINSNYSLTLGNRFLNNKLGIIFSGTFQNTFAGNNASRLVENATLGPARGADATMTQVFPDYLVRKYSLATSRLGLMSTVDYRFNPNHTMSLFGTYLQLNENRVRLTNDLLLGNYSYNGYIGGFQQSFETQTRQSLQNIYSLILQGNHKLLESLKLDWTLAFSEASQQLPDMAAFNITQQISPNSSGTATSLSYGPQAVTNESRQWSHNTDKDISGYLNFHYNTEISNHKMLLSFGGMFRQKSRDNFDNKYSLTAVPDNGLTYQKYLSIPEAKFSFIPHTDALGTAFSNAGVYTFNENVQGVYGQAKFLINGHLESIVGLRVENTSQSYDSSLPETIAGKRASISYLDFLPGLNFKYSLEKEQALRLSYFKSLLRPAYSDLVPYLDKTGFSQDDFGTIGNPNLQHTTIDNFDFRYEVFPKGMDQYMIGAFYKSIRNPIEYALVQGGYAADLQLTPNNFGTAHNYGLEAVFRKFFGNFGLSGNYTYTYSLINSTKKFNYIDLADNSFHNIEVNQARPLQGQAAHIGNISLLYKNSKKMLDAQLALVYTGERINTLSLYKNLDNWERPTINLDFSAQKEFKKHYIIYVKINNLLNTPYQLIVKQPNKAYSGINKLPMQNSPSYATIEKDLYYSRYTLGFRFKF